MKKTLFLLVCLIINFFLFGQTKVSSELTIIANDFKLNKEKSNSENLFKKYSFTKQGEIQYLNTLAKINSKYNRNLIESKGIIIGSKTGDIITMKIPYNLISENINIEGIDYIEPARKIFPLLNKAVKDTRVDSVHKGLGIPQAFSGKNVLIGITDWGFDYTNPMFYDTTLSHTRIIKAWDQYRNAGPAPSGFTYGTEIVGETALLQAQCDTFNIYEWATHGSHVAGICGGSGAGTIYRGVAYDAQYLMATFLVNEAAVLDAFNWMKNYAESVNKRLVINMSWGLYWMGNLDGTSLVNQAIDQLSEDGVVFVSSAGNNGDENLHIKHTFNSYDTLKTVIGFDNYSYYPHMWGQSITIWGDTGTSFQASIKVLNSANVIVAETPFYATNTTNTYTDSSLIIGTDTVFYNLACESENPLNNRPHFRLRVKNKNSAYKIALFSTAQNSTVHYWNVIELDNNVGNWGGPFTNPIAGYTAGDAKYSIGDPASTKSVITVAAHSSEIFLPNGTVSGGALASFSSIGPTLDERMKPDISAPGVNVISSISSFTNAAFSTNPTTSVQFNGRTYPFYKLSGTSMSGPMVTGIVALILQASPTLSAKQIKTIIQQTARKDVNTGVISDTGSTKWGFGKINAIKAIKLALQTQNILNGNFDIETILYPNPAKNNVWIISNDNFMPQIAMIYSLDGRLVKNVYLNGDLIIDIVDLKGVYIVKLFDGVKSINKKLIVL